MVPSATRRAPDPEDKIREESVGIETNAKYFSIAVPFFQTCFL
jgi:hypothetical protein